MKTLLVMVWLIATASANDAEAEATKKVMEVLESAEYSNAIRPSVNGAATDVRVQTYIREIEVDDIKMRIHFDLTFRMIWNDPRLAFGMQEISYVNILKPHLAWLPDAFFKNAITTQLTSVYDESYLRVFNDGKIIYSTRLNLLQSCQMNLRTFPHDTQTCDIKVASYGFTADAVNFMADANAVQVDKGLAVRNFQLDSYEQDSCSSKTVTGVYSCVAFRLVLGRSVSAYLIEWYLLPVALVLVSCLAFLIPTSQFFPRLLTVLLPLLLHLYAFNLSSRTLLPSVSYTRAYDVFAGVSFTFLLAMLVYMIVARLRSAGQDDSSEEGGPKGRGGEEEGGWRGAVQVVARSGSHIVCGVFLASYGVFLVGYFSVYAIVG